MRSAIIIGDGSGVSIVMEAGKREGGVNEVGCEPFAGGAVRCGNAFSLVGGKAEMVKAVHNRQGYE